MKKIKKSTGLCVALFLYVTAMAIYLVPRNHGVSDIEKYLTVAVSYVVVVLLWFVLRRKERLAEHRRKEQADRRNNKTFK